MTIQHQLFLDQLRKSQFLPREWIEAMADDRLEKLVRHAHGKVPFYRQRLAPMLEGGVFHRERWSEVPLLTRLEASEAGAAIHGPRDGTPGSIYIEDKTSGSTGDRFHFRRSRLAVIAAECVNERNFETHAIDCTQHLAIIDSMELGGRGTYPIGGRVRGWSLSFGDGTRTELSLESSIEQQAEWLLRRRPRYVSAYPSVLEALADMIGGDARLDIDAIFTIGETLRPEARAHIEAGFGCRVLNHYACREMGPIATQCPRSGLHVAAECLLVELLDADGNPVPSGEPGRVVVTSYFNHALPMIRYVMGDYAVWADKPCGCGCTLPRLEHVLGRERGFFHFVDGTRKWPTVTYGPLLELAGAKRVQVVQTALDRIEVRRVPRNDGAPPDRDALERLFRLHMHPSLSVTLVTVADLPRAPSGKMEMYVSQVAPVNSNV